MKWDQLIVQYMKNQHRPLSLSLTSLAFCSKCFDAKTTRHMTSVQDIQLQIKSTPDL